MTLAAPSGFWEWVFPRHLRYSCGGSKFGMGRYSVINLCGVLQDTPRSQEMEAVGTFYIHLTSNGPRVTAETSHRSRLPLFRTQNTKEPPKGINTVEPCPNQPKYSGWVGHIGLFGPNTSCWPLGEHERPTGVSYACVSRDLALSSGSAIHP